MSAEAVATPTTKPGIYRGMSFENYVAIDAVNHSILKGFSRTPAHVKYELDHGGKEPTKALDLGWLTHLAVLESERFDAEITIAPKVDRRTKEGKAAWEQFKAANADKYVVNPEEYGKALAMKAALLAHPTAGEALRSKGAAELTIVWEERQAGVVCKARIDRVGYIGEWPVVLDLKTAANASRHSFEGCLAKFGYATQAAHYLAGLEALVPVPVGNPFRRFVFIVVESEPPHAVACYELSEETLQHAEMERQRYLRTWRHCIETGEWKGYGDGIELASYPSWIFKAWSSEGGE